ncbi:MAG: ABC transporter permease [Eubacteriales bacterium]|nr:ABC transporter permease [Eubacteriales bacterium]
MKKKYLSILGSILLLSVVAFFLNPYFIQTSNLLTMIRQASILLMLSLGLTVVVITGNIDLSVGSTAALTGCICAKLMVSGMPIPLSIFLSFFVGIFVGLINGVLVGWLSLPSFVATYGMNMVASGLALMVMQGGVIYDLPKSFTQIGVGYLGAIPIPIILSFIMLFIFWFLLEKTTFGRNIYMIGMNRQAAKFSAVNDLKLFLKTFMLSGLTASAGGIMMTARLNAADAGMSETYGLQIVAAVVVGGTSLLGGEGGVMGTFFGVLILTMIMNIMNMNRVDSNWQNLVLGVLILMIIFLHRNGARILGKFKKKQTRQEV